MTWASNDRIFSSFSDGTGWRTGPAKNRNTRAIWIDGSPYTASFHEIDAYEGPAEKSDEDPRYYGFGALAVGERLYQYLSCAERPSASGWGWNGVKLVYSDDDGRTWRNQDGSAPLVWESYEDRSRNSMLFFDEPQQAFSLVSLLQMGKNYSTNRDGYVYGYGTNGNVDGSMNQLVMFRVPKDRLLERRAYGFFGGMKSGSEAIWVANIGDRVSIHTFPRGWVNTPREGQNVVQSWLPSVVYNATLGIYMMANSGVGCPSDGDWFARSVPSYLGFWTSPSPWGPWTQIHEELAWIPGGDTAARCYSPQISPKWIAPDGKYFWLVWTDFQDKRDSVGNGQTYYAFNTQRFDLIG